MVDSEKGRRGSEDGSKGDDLFLEIPWVSKKPRIGVIGDVILDEYWEGTVVRISPEAPVPVHQVTKQHHVPGGAANAARNVQLAGGMAVLLSVVGCDETGATLKNELRKEGVEVEGIFEDPQRPTVRKTRMVAQGHQMLRVDWEKVEPISEAIQRKILERCQRESFDAVLMSDYGKGLLPESFVKAFMTLAKEKGWKVVVDPKGRDFSKYRGAYLVTPNRKEALEALGLDLFETHSGFELGSMLMKVYGLENVLVTLGAEGMALSLQGSESVSEKALAREVFDVSGAGDTVAALMSLGAASGMDLKATMRFANIGAAVVVGKWGTQPVTLEELEREALKVAGRHQDRRSLRSFASKIVRLHDLYALETFLEEERRKGCKVVFTNGCFDLLHLGHVTYLEEARRLGDTLVVGVNSDQSVRRLKGSKRPIYEEEMRLGLVASLESVDRVVLFDQETPLELIQRVRPDTLVKGGDYDPGAQEGSPKGIVGSGFVRAHGGAVKVIPLVEGYSTSSTVAKIRSL